MLRYSQQPNDNIEAAAKRANELNYDFIYFHPKDVDIKEQRINGLLYQDGEWIKVRTSYPNVIDNAKSRRKYLDIFKDLDRYSILTTRRIGNKDIISDRLIANEDFASIVIPYEPFKTVDQVWTYLEKHEKVVIKPTNQRRGRNIHFVMQHEGSYILY